MAPATKENVVKLRVSDVDLEAWKIAAEGDEMSLSDWIRRRCNGGKASPPLETRKGKR